MGLSTKEKNHLDQAKDIFQSWYEEDTNIYQGCQFTTEMWKRGKNSYYEEDLLVSANCRGHASLRNLGKGCWECCLDFGALVVSGKGRSVQKAVIRAFKSCDKNTYSSPNVEGLYKNLVKAGWMR